MHELPLLQDLAVVMIVAGLVTVLFHRLKQPVVLGYILAGVIIGPHTPPYPLVRDEATIHTLADLGMILLMFALGLEFSLRKLREVGAAALIAALLEILLLFWVGYEVGRLLGWPSLDNIFLGAMLSMSSTTVIIKVLRDLGKTREPFAQLIFGILVLEDILGIAMIALLSGIAMTRSWGVGQVGLTLGKLGLFLLVTLVIGLLGVPRLLGYVARFKSNEMLLITVLGLCFGVALLAARLGYSVALGAFLIGAVMAESREVHRIEGLVEPLRDMFSAIFFVAIGLLIDPQKLLLYWLPILVVTGAVIVGKVLSCSFGAFAGGKDARTALRVGMGLAQIGEFSFIIAALGVTLRVTSEALYPIAVAVSTLTTLLTPYLMRSTDGVINWLARTAPGSLVGYLRLYTRWVGTLGAERAANPARRLIRRWCWQMGLNATLIAAVFVAAACLNRRPPALVLAGGLQGAWLEASLWLAATVLSLPMIIATLRKLQALGLMIAEMKVAGTVEPARAEVLRAIVSQSVTLAGVVVFSVFLLLLSSALIPSLEVFFILLPIAALCGGLLWRASIRVYSKAQLALRETLAEPAPDPAGAGPAGRPALLLEANLERLELPGVCAAAGKRIHELQLRSRTGASIVGIERPGRRLINPDPEEELQVGDQVLLLGNPGQLAAAREILAAPGGASAPL